MGDVLVKGMKLPKNCGCCDMCILSKDRQNFFCTRQIGKQFHWTLAEQRQEGCPLVEVKEGVWFYYGNGVYKCSECHEQYILDDTPSAHKYHFCPNCGARMEV